MQLRPHQLALLRTWRPRLAGLAAVVLLECGLFAVLRQAASGAAVPAEHEELAALRAEETALETAVAGRCAAQCGGGGVDEGRRRRLSEEAAAGAVRMAADRDAIWRAVQPFVTAALTAPGAVGRRRFSFLDSSGAAVGSDWSLATAVAAEAAGLATVVALGQPTPPDSVSLPLQAWRAAVPPVLRCAAQVRHTASALRSCSLRGQATAFILRSCRLRGQVTAPTLRSRRLRGQATAFTFCVCFRSQPPRSSGRSTSRQSSSRCTGPAGPYHNPPALQLAVPTPCQQVAGSVPAATVHCFAPPCVVLDCLD